MKIAIIVPSLANRGPIIVVKDIIDNLIDIVDLIEVFYFDDLIEIEFPCKCIKISFWETIRFDNYDIIHSHMLRPDIYIWKNKNKIRKAICITTLHQDIRQNLNASYNRLIGYVFEKIWLYILSHHEIVVTLSNCMKEEYSEQLSANKIRKIYNGRKIPNNSIYETDIEASDLKLIEEIKSKYKIIGTLALLTKRKGIHQIVESLPFLNDYALIIVGDGKERSNLIELSKSKGVEDRCIFLGYKINAIKYLKYFDIYAMPSTSEGFGLGLLEAALFKLPIVCSNIKIFKELYSDNEVSFFELNNIQSLINAIIKADKHKVPLSKNIYESVSNKYSDKAMAENYFKLYLESIKK